MSVSVSEISDRFCISLQLHFCEPVVAQRRHHSHGPHRDSLYPGNPPDQLD